jgi:hypothetical protein
MLEWLWQGALFESVGMWLFVVAFWVVCGIVWVVSKLFSQK